MGRKNNKKEKQIEVKLIRLVLFWYYFEIRVIKIHNLSIRQATLEFNMNYCALSHYYKKILEYDYQPWNMWQSTSSMELIVTFSQFHLKLNNLFVR